MKVCLTGSACSVAADSPKARKGGVVRKGGPFFVCEGGALTAEDCHRRHASLRVRTPHGNDSPRGFPPPYGRASCSPTIILRWSRVPKVTPKMSRPKVTLAIWCGISHAKIILRYHYEIS